MKYTKKDLGSYNLHLVETNKFKTITIRVVFHTPIQKEEITSRAILCDMLLQSSEKYKTRREMTKQAENLYSADIATNNQRLGNYILTSFHMQVLHDKYTEEGNFEKALEFLSDILYHPDIEEKKFQTDKLDIAKYNSVVSISSMKEDTAAYSLIRMAEAYDKNSPLAYHMVGYIEDLEKVNEKNLYDTYTKMIENDYVDIFVVGDFNQKEMFPLITKYFKFKKIKKAKGSYFLPIKKPRKRRLLAKETVENTQSKLSIACPFKELTTYERNYPLVLANFILGGETESKLFQEVREKNSLCYTIHSSAHKLDNVLTITAGIDKDNYTKTLDLITKILNELKKGHFTEKDINVAKEFYHTYLEEMEESENRMITEILSSEILKQDPFEERFQKMEKVKKRDITKVFKKLNMDTVFLLEGEKHEED